MKRSPDGQLRRRPIGRRALFIPLLTVGAVALLSGISTPGEAAQSPAGERRAAELERQLGSGAEVRLSAETGFVRFLGTTPRRPVNRPPGLGADAGAETAARAYLRLYGEGFGVRDERRQLKLDEESANRRGDASVRFQQLYEDVPVLGGQLVVNLDRNRNLKSMSGELLPPSSLRVEPRIGRDEAGETAIAAVAKDEGLAAGLLQAARPELRVYDSRLLGGPGLDAPRLVWETEVTATGRPIREFVLVDAGLGSVALRFDQIAHAKVREVCDAGNADAEYPCTPVLAERSEGEAATGNPDVDDAYDFSGDTYDFFADRFGRDSLDDNGMELRSTVRYCPSGEPCPYENAYWDGAQMVYGEGFAAADDVVGHELAHGVTEFSSRLFYYYQSGSINESMSDVFGEFVDLTNDSGSDSAADRWLLGEDIPGIGAIRDMADPTSFGDPDRMTSPNYTADVGEVDAGGVHTNSGVNNKAAYLMTDGDTFNGRTVSGLGIDKVARIYYEVETAMLTSASDYADLASGLSQACSNLVGIDGITVADCESVDDAVQVTEMNLQPPAAPAPEAPTCTSGTPVATFSDDLENPAAGNWKLTSNLGNNEWYYPQNSNPYGFDATYATSGTKNLWGYDRPSTGDYSIEMSSDVTVPAAPAFMRFEHAYGFEDSTSPPRKWDGGVIEYSIDGGSTWSDAGGLITDNGYSGTITSTSGSTNPLKGRGAFVGESNGYISSRLDLASLSGEQIRFRFRIGTDAIVDDYGWFVDDVQIYGCTGGDTTPPDTTIDSGPSGTIATDQATFTFSGTPASDTAKIQCRIDSEPFTDCTSPKTFTGLTDGPHTAEFRAEDAAGNQDPTPATRTFTVDTTPPDTTIDSGPAGPTNDPTPTFEFSSEPGATFECRVDTDAFYSCSSPETVASLTDGPHTFEVRATDSVGNTDPTPATRTFTVDTTPPDTTIDSGPSGTIATDQATFTFSGTPASDTAKIQCRIDSEPFTDCTSPKTFTGLTDGPHTAEFRAEDAAGNQDPTPATRTFTVDTTPPDTTIDSGPTGTTGDATPTFEFSSEPGATFECRVDTDAFSPCSSPETVASLTDGPHTFEVRPIDPAGNTDPSPATRSFTVDTTPPDTTIDSGPAGPTNDPTPTFEFSSEPGATFECRVDTDAFYSCSSPETVASLTDGPHTFEVRATDSVGNTDPSPATRSFTVDTTPPDTTIDSGPTGTTGDATPTFEFSSEPGATFECRVDTDAFSPCSSPETVASLTDGPHTFEVRAIDPAGNTDPSPATRSFTVDTTPPDTTIDSGPAGPTNDPTPTFSFSSGDAGSSFECKVDGDTLRRLQLAGDRCLADRRPSHLRGPSHRPAGNTDPTPASRSFTVDTNPPDTTIDSGPTGPTNDPTPTFGFASNEAGVQLSSARSTAAASTPAARRRPLPSCPTALTPFAVRATDPAGNTDPTPATRDFTVDATPPKTTIDSGPTGTTSDATPTFEFSSEPGATFECRVDTDAFYSCSSPETVASLTDGPHTFEVRATDSVGNTDPSPATRSFTVDTVPPALEITSGPSGVTDQQKPTFGFTAEPGSSLQCSIDTGIPDFGPCSGSTSHTPAQPLADDDYSFRVRATDSASNQSTRTRSFTVSAAPPDTTIDSGPSGTIATDQATFTFSGTPASDTAKIQCRIDSEPFTDCTSPKTFTGLTDGPHTAEFRAEDAAGNQDPTPATRTFTVDTTPPDTTIDSGPTGTTGDATPTFEFSSEPGATFECRVDTDAFSSCSSPETVASLTDGPHTFEVRATDSVGNTDPTPATRTFTVDTTPPDTTIDSGPSGTIATDQATFTFSGTPASDTAKIQCRIDSEPFTDCTSPKTFTGLTDGPHTAEFRAEDAAGNQDPTPATRTFTVDTTPPDTTIDSGPAGPTNDPTPTFEFSSEPGATFECRVDTDAFYLLLEPRDRGLADRRPSHLRGKSNRFGRQHRPEPGHAFIHGRHHTPRHNHRLRPDRHNRRCDPDLRVLLRAGCHLRVPGGHRCLLPLLEPRDRGLADRRPSHLRGPGDRPCRQHRPEPGHAFIHGRHHTPRHNHRLRPSWSHQRPDPDLRVLLRAGCHLRVPGGHRRLLLLLEPRDRGLADRRPSHLRGKSNRFGRQHRPEPGHAFIHGRYGAAGPGDHLRPLGGDRPAEADFRLHRRTGLESSVFDRHRHPRLWALLRLHLPYPRPTAGR